MKKSLHLTKTLAVVTCALGAVQLACAQTVWTGGGGANTNWSNTANWSTTLSPAGTDVVFGDQGAAGTAGAVNSAVDSSSLSPASLTFTNMSQNSLFHTILVPAGVTLANPGTLLVGGTSAPTVGTTNAMTGAGTFVQSGAMNVKWIGGTSGGSMAALDLSGLNTFVYDSSGGTITVASAPSGSEARGGGLLTLAGTSNSITASTIAVALGTGNGGAGGTLILGAGTNIINVGTVNVAAGKINTGTIKFAGTTGGLRLRGTGGTDADRASFTLGRRGNSGTGTITGSALLNGHPVDILADTITLGQSTANQTGQTVNGILAFDSGNIDANTINLAVCSGNAGAIANGTLVVGGGKLIVNTGLSLVNQTLGVATGTLNITNGGTVICSNGIVKTTSTGTANISINIGALAVAGALGSASAPINTLNISDATLTLEAGLAATANATTLSCGGTTNKINVSALPTIASYPAQFPLIKYAGTLGGTFNIGVGTFPASTPPFAGYISNNVANGSIDIVLTSGIMPARSLSWRGSTDGSWDTTTPNWAFAAAATTYNQKDFVRFDDTATGVTDVSLTTAVPGLAPSGVTVSNIAKSYRFGGAGFLTGETGLTKDGSGTLTIANDGVDDFTGPIAIVAGTLRYNHAFDTSVSNVISGAGTLNQAGLASLTLYGANTLDGPITVTQGTLRTGNNSALGSTNGATTIANGASLDIGANNINLGQEPIIVSGDGVYSGGAIVNSSGNNNFVGPNLARVTLAGNTRIGGSGRWDLRSPAGTSADPALASLSTGGNAYSLTKVGANTVNLVAVTVDPALADIAVNEGLLGFEGNTTSAGNPARTLSIASMATLRFYALTNIFDKNIVIQDSGIVANGSGANTVIGPMTLNGTSTTFDVGGTSLTLSNSIAGTAMLNKIGNGRLVLAGTASHTGGTAVNGGTLELRGIHNGGMTNQGLAVISGTGTNNGVVDAMGPIVPGASNIVGTLTTGPLILEYGTTLAYDLASDNTPGAGINDLVVVNGDLTINGNTIAINPMGLLQKSTYRLFTYTGNLIWNADLYIPDQMGYSFTWNTSIPGQVNLVVTARPPVWNGGSTVGSYWSDAANWDGAAITYGSVLYFAGNNRLNNTNDTTGVVYGDTVFAADAGSFRLNGNPLTLGGNIVNSSANPQTVNLGLSFGANYAFNGASNTLVIGGGVTNTANLTVLTLAGTGILSNQLASADANSITNSLLLNTTNANWTLMDNPSSTAISIPVQLDIQAGTLNFGAGSSAPVLTSTTQRGAPQDQRVGNISGTVATLNVVNGTLTTMARLNTATAGGATGIVNQVGGTFNLGDQFQGANGAASSVSAVSVSGGTMNIGSATNPASSFYVASRGPGSLTVSGSGVLNCGTLDVSRSINGSIPGTVSLDGGTITATRVSTATANAGAATTGSTATFNFNGGTLKARASSSTFFQGRTSGPAVPITAVVKAGGAILDTDTNAISILEPLLHDSALDLTPDGGLRKEGAGTLTLTATNTYTGDTLVNQGTLVINGTLAATAVTVASGATLAGTGSMGSNVTISAGGTIAPGNPGAIGTLTVASNAVLRGIVSVEINRAAGAVTNDLLRAATIDLGGALVVTNAGPALSSGDSFTLFSGVLSGSINPSTLPPLSPGLSWDTSALNTLGRISVIGSPVPPGITASGIVGGSFNLAGSGGMPGGTYYVLASTNVALPLNGWTRVATNAFDGSGNFSASIVMDPAAAKTFYLIQLP